MNRPEGQPGTVWYGQEREDIFWDKSSGDEAQTVRTGLTYPAVLSVEGWLFMWRDGEWVHSPGFADYFTPGEEWEADCTHEGLVPWKGCDTEADCIALRREEARMERAES